MLRGPWRLARSFVVQPRLRIMGRSALGLSVVLLFASSPALANPLKHPPHHHLRPPPPPFALEGAALGDTKPAPVAPAYLAGSTVAALDDDHDEAGGALVLDADSGFLIRTDATGAEAGKLEIGAGAGLVVYDPIAHRAFAVDRRGDRIVVVNVGAKLTLAATWSTPVEPYGIALSPDRRTLLVTAIADRVLSALDSATGNARWNAPLAGEPRGIAISPDGTSALVTHLTTGTVERFALAGAHRAATIALQTTAFAETAPAQPVKEFARGAFAATYLGPELAVVPFLREVPAQQANTAPTSSYGGGFESPITPRLAFIGAGSAQVPAKILDGQPHALAWDSARDALFVAGAGSDSLLRLDNASQVTVRLGRRYGLTAPEGTRCGPEGVAVARDGSALVWCALTRKLVRIKADAAVTYGPELVASRLTAEQHRGMELFTSEVSQISRQPGVACVACHPDTRADGLSWSTDGQPLQTPILAGRLVGTHPFKWDGTDPDLAASLTSTMKRLGGGLEKPDSDALIAYLEALPPVRTPAREAASVARGRAVFESAGCTSCHDGPRYTDQARHKLPGSPIESDTPSLVGIAASAPYFHDGSAPTLEAVLRDQGTIHGMIDEASPLSSRQLADLKAFLETL